MTSVSPRRRAFGYATHVEGIVAGLAVLGVLVASVGLGACMVLCAREHWTPMSGASADSSGATTTGKPRPPLVLSAPEGIRTPNLLIRSQMLYPLSYGRMLFSCGGGERI